MRAIGLSTIAAVVIQPVVFWAWFLLPALFYGAAVTIKDIFAMAFYVIVVAFAFVVVLGVPLFLVLRYFNRANWLHLCVSGFLAGAIPLAVYSWPSSSRFNGYSSGGNWHGRYVELFVNGAPTTYGWLSYAESVTKFGVHGVVAALIFLFVWQRLAHPVSHRQDA